MIPIEETGKPLDDVGEPPTAKPSTHRVRKRCVFYLSGFDPRGARHYHDLYRTQAQLRPTGNTSSLNVTPRFKDTEGIAWKANFTSGRHTTTTIFKFLAWDDIVRSEWPHSRLRHWIEYAKASSIYLSSGFFKKFREICDRLQIRGEAAAALLYFPNKLVALTISGIIATTGLTFWLTAGLTGQAWLGLLLCCIPPLLIWESAHRFEERRNLSWIMRSFAFTSKQAQGRVPELDARLDHFANQVIARVTEDTDDEILIIGHSSGAIMAASVMARALQTAPDLLQHRAQIGLVTLGQCIPMLGLLPGATKFRNELRILGQESGLIWVDISSPADRCCVAMTDPISASGVELDDSERKILFISINPRFHTLFDTHSYHEIKKNAYQMHFQYLCTQPIKSDFDYFEISAGTLSLKDRITPIVNMRLPEDFDPVIYLELNPDVAKAKIKPAEHYLKYGKAELRRYKRI